MPALNIHDAPKGTEARRTEQPGALGCPECIFYSGNGRCTKSSPRRCGAYAREDRGDVCFVEATGKPRVSLRTHSGVPTPPEWAKSFRPIDKNNSFAFCSSSVEDIHDFWWNQDENAIIAVEWLK